MAKKTTSKSPAKKVAPKKAVAKAPAKKVATKAAAPKKAVAKAPAKKVATKAVAPKKAVAKAPAKKVATKATAPKKAVAKAPAKKGLIKKRTLSAIDTAKTKAHVSNQPTPTFTTETYVHKDKDTQNSKPQGRLIRYNDEDLNEFKMLITGKLSKAQEEINFYQEQIKNAADNDNKATGLEDGAFTTERESLNQLIARQQKLIAHLENALARIENKTYGICRETGQLIPKDRLRAVPHATLSVEAKKKQK